MKQYKIDSELRDKIITWLNNISSEADSLTTANVAHKKAMIKGMALRSAEYLVKHCETLEKGSGEEIKNDNKEGYNLESSFLRLLYEVFFIVVAFIIVAYFVWLIFIKS